MSEEEMRALMLLAGIEVTQAYRLANEYCGAACCSDRPWWLVKTTFGFLKIGWRKRVINIDWAETAFRGVITDDDVTKDNMLVHAWGYAKAVEYLTQLERHLSRLAARSTPNVLSSVVPLGGAAHG